MFKNRLILQVKVKLVVIRLIFASIFISPAVGEVEIDNTIYIKLLQNNPLRPHNKHSSSKFS